MIKTKIHRKQISFSFLKTNWKHQYSHGGILRQKRAGRGQRPLSSKDPLHLVFKINSSTLKTKSLRTTQNYKLVNLILKKYANMFFVKMEQVSIQKDHIHSLIRTTRRSHFHYFFRVVAGQIAQQFEKKGYLVELKNQENLVVNQMQNKDVTDTQKAGCSTKSIWKYRPFTRVVKGYKAYRIVRNYIQLNEQEVLGNIRYSKKRLRGFSLEEWGLLWC